MVASDLLSLALRARRKERLPLHTRIPPLGTGSSSPVSPWGAQLLIYHSVPLYQAEVCSDTFIFSSLLSTDILKKAFLTLTSSLLFLPQSLPTPLQANLFSSHALTMLPHGPTQWTRFPLRWDDMHLKNKTGTDFGFCNIILQLAFLFDDSLHTLPDHVCSHLS